jgi:hypothetical protein
MLFRETFGFRLLVKSEILNKDKKQYTISANQKLFVKEVMNLMKNKQQLVKNLKLNTEVVEVINPP